MEIRLFSTVHLDASFREYLTAKIEKLGRFIFDEGSAEFHLKKEGPQFISELRVHSKHQTLFVKEQSPDLNTSVELLLDKVRNKLRKAHERVIDRSHRG